MQEFSQNRTKKLAFTIELCYNVRVKFGSFMESIMFWDVIVNGEVVDTVWYNTVCDSVYVRNSLIDYDGYPSCIMVVPA